jgi:hypothetical protein
MCVTALLLGRRQSDDVVDRVFAGMVAALCSFPCRVLLPKLFKSANAPPGDRRWRQRSPAVSASLTLGPGFVEGGPAPFYRGGTAELKSGAWLLCCAAWFRRQ